MKRIFLLSAVVLFVTSVRSQNVQESRVNFAETSVPGYTLTLDRNADFVKAALKDRMERIGGLKSKSTKGFVSYQEQYFGEISTSPINIYTAVEEVGKKNNKQTIVTFFVLTPELKPIETEEISANIRQFLVNFNQYLTKFEAFQKMNVELDNLKKAQKEQASLVSDKTGLEKEIASKNSKIESKKKEIESYQEKIRKNEEEISNLSTEIKTSEKKKNELEVEISKANNKINLIQGEVDKYKMLSE